MTTYVVQTAGDSRRLADYGIVAESIGTFQVADGNNPLSAHRLQVWTNVGRTRPGVTLPEGMYLGPRNEITREATTILMQAEATVIALHALGDRGPNLGRIVAGDRVIILLPNGKNLHYILEPYRWGVGWSFRQVANPSAIEARAEALCNLRGEDPNDDEAWKVAIEDAQGDWDDPVLRADAYPDSDDDPIEAEVEVEAALRFSVVVPLSSEMLTRDGHVIVGSALREYVEKIFAQDSVMSAATFTVISARVVE